MHPFSFFTTRNLLTTSYAPTSPSIGTVSASGATASWTVPNGPGYSPSSYTVLIYQDSTSSVSTSSTLFATKPNQTSGSSISFSATSVNYYAIVVVAVYTGIISTSMQYIVPPTFNSVSASWFYGTTQSGTPSFSPSSSAPTQINFNFAVGDGSIYTANNLKIIFNGAGGVQIDYLVISNNSSLDSLSFSIDYLDNTMVTHGADGIVSGQNKTSAGNFIITNTYSGDTILRLNLSGDSYAFATFSVSISAGGGGGV